MALGEKIEGAEKSASAEVEKSVEELKEKSSEKSKKESNLKEKSSEIILQHPFLKQDAVSALYVNDKEVSLNIKDGIVLLKLNKEEHIRDILIKEGWIDKTEYALETKKPEPPKSIPKVLKWSFFHPNASTIDPLNGNIAFKKRDGSEAQLEVINNLITTDDEELADIMKSEKFSPGNVEYEKEGK